MAIPPELLPHYTYEDYKHWRSNWKVIGGIPSPLDHRSRSAAHDRIAGNLLRLFRTELGRQHSAWQAYPPIDYLLSEDTVFQPDLLITRGAVNGPRIDPPPLLVGEVVSAYTARKDRQLKFPRYQVAGVKYLVLAAMDAQESEIYVSVAGAFQLMSNARDPVFEFTFPDATVLAELGGIWD